MKKLVFAALLLVAAFTTSCNKGKACYEIKLTVAGAASVSAYFYGTQEEANQQAKILEISDMHTSTVTKVDKAEADCVGGNMDFDFDFGM